MKIHSIKIEEKWWERLISDEKKCELRLNDRDYQVGDEIRFIAMDGFPLPSEFDFIITHVLNSNQCEGLKDGYCVISLKTKYKPLPSVTPNNERPHAGRRGG